MIPGENIPGGRRHYRQCWPPRDTIGVANKGDRPIQVGSHFHFYEVNTALEFDREKAYGMRLQYPVRA